MTDELFEAVTQLLDGGVAPGGAIALLRPGVKPAYFAHGHFAGASSPLVTPNTVYDLASITKLFTTALVLRLHEQNKLSLYDACVRYLPNFKGSNIRIIDLLTHRLGIDLSLAQFSQGFSDAQSFRRALLELKPPREPLNMVAYANIQLFYAGVIVEQVTGQSLNESLRQLFAELALQHTLTGPDIAGHHVRTPPTEVIGNTVIQGVTHDESSRKIGGIAGNAGIFSSIVDLAQFGQAWLDGRIVNHKLLDEFVFINYDPAGSTPQALGWWLRITNPDGSVNFTPGIYSHTGFTGSLLAINANNGRTAAFACNRTYYGRDNKKQRVVWQLLITWLES